MFSFRVRAGGADFADALGWRNAVLLVATLSWPFLLGSAVSATSCRNVGGACGALALVLSLYVKPFVYLIFLATLLPWTIRRWRDAGLPRLLRIPLVAMLVMGKGFWLVASAPWSVGFVVGAGGGVAPVVPAGFACLLALACLRTWPSVDGRSKRELSSWVWLATGLYLAVLLFQGFAAAYAHKLILANPHDAGAKLSSVLIVSTVLAGIRRIVENLLPLAAAIVAAKEWHDAGRPGEGSLAVRIATAGAGFVAVASVILLIVDLVNVGVLVPMPTGGLPNGSHPASALAQVVLPVANAIRIAELMVLMLLPFAVSPILGGSSAASAPEPVRPQYGEPTPAQPVRKPVRTSLAPGAPQGFGRRQRPA